VRRAREAAGLSQEQLGAKFGYSGDQVGKVETGERTPSRKFAVGCDKVFPEWQGMFLRLYDFACAQGDGPSPTWFADWLEAERRAVSIRWWEPLLIPGLLQTPDYARAVLRVWPSIGESDVLEEMVSARLARQTILDRPEPPSLGVLIDEPVLYRCIGSAKVMQDQLCHLGEMSHRPKVTIQILPGDLGAHVGLLGALAIATFDDMTATVYMESPDEGHTTSDPAVVAKISDTWDVLRSDALPQRASRDLISKAEARWTE